MKEFFGHAWDILIRFTGAAAGLLGGGNGRVLCILMALDYASGLALGCLGKSKKTRDGRLSARASFQGLLKKGMMLSVILLAAFLDRLAGQDDLLYRAATGFYICNEGISLLENAALLGVPVPGKIRKALSALQEEA
ncbi:MAG: phage holin family protein [Clostridia bacterium]|nr:phage holin family protein [Clostridia bacterium]